MRCSTVINTLLRYTVSKGLNDFSIRAKTMNDKYTSDLNIVGIGASAGGLEALEAFFINMPSDTGLSFVVVQHLSPESESILSQILQRYTEMPVMQVVEETPIEPNHIYVIPPKHDIGAVDNTLKLYEPTASILLNRPNSLVRRGLSTVPECSATSTITPSMG